MPGIEGVETAIVILAASAGGKSQALWRRVSIACSSRRSDRRERPGSGGQERGTVVRPGRDTAFTD
jgi:hypothetical protein